MLSWAAFDVTVKHLDLAQSGSGGSGQVTSAFYLALCRSIRF